MKSVLVGVLAVWAAGCCEKYKCATPLAQINVRDSAGGVVPDVKVEGEGLMPFPSGCRPDGGSCLTISGPSGTAVVSAPGFKPVSVKLERKVDDCGNGLAQHVDVVLVPDSGVEQSSARLTQAVGCH